MTKEIIIDGVNVAGCDYFVRQRGFNCYMGKNCTETSECYFKQLQRLKQENEELKKRQITKNGFICDCEQNTKYKQALEEIKNFSENFCSNNCPYYTDKESNVCNDGCLLDDIVNPIIKKIVEVLND